MKTLAWSMIVTESYLYIFLFFKWIIQWLKILQMCHWFNQWLEITFTRNESKYGKSSKPWLNIYNPQKYFLKIWTIRLSSWRFWFNKRWKSNFLKRFFFFLIYFLIMAKLRYNIVVVSAVQQHKSVMMIYMYPVSWAFLPSPHPTPLGHQRVPRWAPSVIYIWQIPTSFLFYIW